MEATLKVLNRMEEAGVIQRYAIGGAVGAAFYVEPSLTYDLDVFTAFESSAVIDLSPLYEWLRERGHLPKGAGVMIEGWEVQFLAPGTPLVEEALAQARETTFKRVRTRVFQAEHLALIMLETGRPKDRARLCQFVEEGAIEKGRMIRLARRFGLEESWSRFLAMFFENIDEAQ